MKSSTLSSSSSSSSSLYYFKIKQGDGLRTYDGLVGYWPSLAPTHLKNPSGGPIPGNALDFSILYSYYGPSEAPITHISTSNFPVLHPYHVDPTSRASGTNPETFHAQHCRILQAFGALIVSRDIPERPPLPPAPAPAPEGGTTKGKEVAADVDGRNNTHVRIPALALAKPLWLQPYVAEGLLDGTDEGSDHGDSHDEDDTPLERAIVYGTFDVMSPDDKMRLEDGPYTALEGYTKLRRPGPDGGL